MSAVWSFKYVSFLLQIDEQLQCLTETLQLTEENISLRFLVCSLLRDIAGAYFPECIIRPFGSSVNSFGKLGCDVDMILDLDGIYATSQKKVSSVACLSRLNLNRIVNTHNSIFYSSLCHCIPECLGTWRHFKNVTIFKNRVFFSLCIPVILNQTAVGLFWLSKIAKNIYYKITL